MAQFNITADSFPIFDEWGWAPYWKAEDWLTWLDLMNEQYGQAEAAQRFYDAWWSRDGFWEGLGDVRYDWLWSNENFINTLESYDLPNGSNLYAAVQESNLLNGVFKAGSDVVGGVSNVVGKAGKTVGGIGNALPIIVIVALVIIGFVLYRKGKFVIN